MKWSSLAGVALALGLGLALAGSAGAQQGNLVPPPGGGLPDAPILVNLMVAHLSNEPGGVDPAARKLDRKLRTQFRYQSLKVLEQRHLSLALDEVGSIALPDGRSARVKPIHQGPNGVLMAVDVEGAVKTDVRVQKCRMVVIRAGDYDDGSLVFSVEPNCD